MIYYTVQYRKVCSPVSIIFVCFKFAAFIYAIKVLKRKYSNTTFTIKFQMHQLLSLCQIIGIHVKEIVKFTRFRIYVFMSSSLKCVSVATQ